MTLAKKNDSGKPRFDLIPPEALFAAAEVFMYGANKYGDRNWELGLEYDRLFAAIQRHLWSYQAGEEINEEDFGLPHLHHALASLMMLVTLKIRAKQIVLIEKDKVYG